MIYYTYGGRLKCCELPRIEFDKSQRRWISVADFVILSAILYYYKKYYPIYIYDERRRRVITRFEYYYNLIHSIIEYLLLLLLFIGGERLCEFRKYTLVINYNILFDV